MNKELYVVVAQKFDNTFDLINEMLDKQFQLEAMLTNDPVQALNYLKESNGLPKVLLTDEYFYNGHFYVRGDSKFEINNGAILSEVARELNPELIIMNYGGSFRFSNHICVDLHQRLKEDDLDILSNPGFIKAMQTKDKGKLPISKMSFSSEDPVWYLENFPKSWK